MLNFLSKFGLKPYKKQVVVHGFIRQRPLQNRVPRVQVLLPLPSRGYKKDIARENPDKIGVFTVLYGKISAADFVDVNRSFSLYVRF